MVAAISSLVDRQMMAEDNIVELNRQVDEAKANLRKIEEKDFPDLMVEMGIPKFTLDSGIEVELKTNVFASLTEERREDGHAWLEENGHGDLIKREFIIRFNRDEESWAKKFARDLAQRKKQVALTIKRAVPPPTLKKFVVDALHAGDDVPLETFGVFEKKVTKIKRPKED